MRTGPPAFVLRGARWWTRPGDDPREVARTLEQVFAALERGDAPNTKTGRRKALHRVHVGGDGGDPDYLLKGTTYPPRSALSRLFRPAKSVHELQLALALAARGLPTPVPLAAGEERRRGRLLRCWLLVPFVAGSVDLLALARAGTLSHRERASLARALGRLARTAHDAGLFQDDFAPNNFLVGPAPTRDLSLLDFERARLRRRGVSDAERRWMLAKLERAMPETSDRERWGFLLAYSGGDRTSARRWWAALHEESVRLALRDVRRMGRTATRPGRRFRPVEVGLWRGYARRETSDVQLAGLAGFAAAEGAPVALGATACAIERTGVDARTARDAWSRGIALGLRGLAAAPSALLHRGGVARLRFERAVTRDDAWRHPESARALRRLLVRLLALGELRPEARLASFALDEAEAGKTPRAVLLDPHVFQLQRDGSPRSAPATRRAAEIAARLLERGS